MARSRPRTLVINRPSREEFRTTAEVWFELVNTRLHVLNECAEVPERTASKTICRFTGTASSASGGSSRGNSKSDVGLTICS